MGVLWPLLTRTLAFRRNFRALLHRLVLPDRARILDIGCSTGAYVSVLADMGHEVQAADASPRMVATARRLLRHERLNNRAIQVSVGNPLQGLNFPDRHFDLVFAAHVIHGMLPAQRRQFYREARRFARGSGAQRLPALQSQRSAGVAGVLRGGRGDHHFTGFGLVPLPIAVLSPSPAPAVFFGT
jgi:SAM-dependent methyltransferase